MSVHTTSVHYFHCTCDKCGKEMTVAEDRRIGIYNAAQAVRSLGWSYGKDKSVFCFDCRRNNRCDNYGPRYKW